MWAHYTYLLLLPTMAVVSARMMFPADDFHQVLLIAGFPLVLMYTLFLANGYALPDSLPVALIVTLAIPAQIALSFFCSAAEASCFSLPKARLSKSIRLSSAGLPAQFSSGAKSLVSTGLFSFWRWYWCCFSGSRVIYFTGFLWLRRLFAVAHSFLHVICSRILGIREGL